MIYNIDSVDNNTIALIKFTESGWVDKANKLKFTDHNTPPLL